MAESEQPDLTQLTVQLLSAYVGNNSVAAEDLAGLIASTRAALSLEAAPAAVEEPTHAPAVSIRKSLASPDYLLSLIDGKPYKLLKRHLAQHGLTPDQYRTRYNLPRDYPTVAKSYSEQRRATAARTGLGGRVAAKTPEASSASDVPAVSAAVESAKTAATTASSQAASPAADAKGKTTAGRTPKAKTAPAKSASAKPASTKAAAASKQAAKPARAKAKLAAPAKPVTGPEATSEAPAPVKAKPARKAAAPKATARAAAAQPAAALVEAGKSPDAAQAQPATSPAAVVAQQSEKAPSVKSKPEAVKAAKSDATTAEKKPRRKLGLKIA